MLRNKIFKIIFSNQPPLKSN